MDITPILDSALATTVFFHGSVAALMVFGAVVSWMRCGAERVPYSAARRAAGR